MALSSSYTLIDKNKYRKRLSAMSDFRTYLPSVDADSEIIKCDRQPRGSRLSKSVVVIVILFIARPTICVPVRKKKEKKNISKFSIGLFCVKINESTVSKGYVTGGGQWSEGTRKEKNVANRRGRHIADEQKTLGPPRPSNRIASSRNS